MKLEDDMTDKKSFTEDVCGAFGAAFLFVATIIVAAPITTAFGALAGWTTGLVFGPTILGTLALFGIHGVTMAQLGATAGFLGAFLRTQTTVNPAKS